MECILRLELNKIAGPVIFLLSLPLLLWFVGERWTVSSVIKLALPGAVIPLTLWSVLRDGAREAREFLESFLDAPAPATRSDPSKTG